MGLRKRRKLTTGELGWIGLICYILSVDYCAFKKDTETMSNSFGRWVSKKPGLTICGVIWTTITIHLWYNVIYGAKRTKAKTTIATLDPISLIGKGLFKLAKRQNGTNIVIISPVDMAQLVTEE